MYKIMCTHSRIRATKCTARISYISQNAYITFKIKAIKTMIFVP